LVNHFTDTEAGIEDNPEKAEAFTNEMNGTEPDKKDDSNGENKAAGEHGWKKNDTGWWYENDDGSYAKDEWKQINDKWYRFNEQGYMQTGWVQGQDGKWYYLGADGAMVTGT